MTDRGARCPGCNISFRITGAQRRAAGGLVRCGFCLLPFDANAHSVALAPEPAPAAPPRLRPDTDDQLEHRIDADPQARSATESPYGASESMPAPLDVSVAPGEPEPEPEPEPELEAKETTPQSDGDSPSPALPPAAATPEHRAELMPDAPPDASPEPVVATPSPAPPPWLEPRAAPARSRAAAAIVIAALVTLLLQGLYFHADQLHRRPALRGFYGTLCQVVPCRQPAYPDVAAIAVDQVMVRNQTPGALRLDAMLTNRGRATLPLPRVRLRFENLQGEVVAERRFAPAEYMDPSAADALAVGQSLHLVLELVDPGPEAVSYALAPVD